MEEQSMLITTAPSLQSLLFIYYIKFVISPFCFLYVKYAD